MKKEENMEREMDDSFLDEKFKKNPFLVPDYYFENLEDQILAVSKLSSEAANNYKVPEGYFEDMNAKILSQVNLNNATNGNGFDIPEEYFEGLSAKLLSQTNKPETTKVVKFSFIKYAAAAVLLIATTFGAYLYNTNNNNVSDKLANIPEQEIMEYLKFYTDPNDVSFIIESTDDFSDLEENINREMVN